jgi:hypothetical protein
VVEEPETWPIEHADKGSALHGTQTIVWQASLVHDYPKIRVRSVTAGITLFWNKNYGGLRGRLISFWLYKENNKLRD